MSLDHYSRIDLTKVQTTCRNTMKLFPLGKKSMQKVIIGDESGTIQSFGIKKGYVNNNFKVTPRDKKITSIQMFKDKAFVSSSRTVRGMNKTGKEFYTFETGMTEDIKAMGVVPPNLWTAGDYSMFRYEDSNEMGCYMCPDKICDVTNYSITGAPISEAVLGCHDRVIRVVQDSNVLLEIVVEGPANSVTNYNYQAKETPSTLLYGTENGVMGSLLLREDSVKKIWDVTAKHSVQIINNSSVFGTGEADILVGRDNGIIGIYSFDSSPVPRLIFERNVEESITGIEAGYMASRESKEIVISTYSGKVLVYSGVITRPETLAVDTESSISKLAKRALTGSQQQKVVGTTHQEQVASLTKEIQKMEGKLIDAKARYNSLSVDMVAVHCKYSVKSKMILDAENACYRLSVELDISIDMVSLYSDAPIDIVDLGTPNYAISNSTPDSIEEPKLLCKFLAVFRATETGKRFEVLIRTVEGQYGTLEVYIIPKVTPKICKVETFQIKPLALHQRVHELTTEERPMNTLNVSGAFSVPEMHSWVGACLEDIPDKVLKDEVEYFFSSTFQDTILSIRIKKGEAIFKSDNATTLSVLDEIVAKEATERKKRVNTSYQISDEAYASVLTLLYPKVEYQLNLSEKVKLVDALKELEMQETDMSFLSASYRDILENKKQLLEENANQTRRLSFLYNVILKLYSDKWKFKRQNGQKQIDQLARILNSKEYDLKTLINLFKQ